VALQRPATKILVAGGLTLAGWLLGAALSGSTAAATQQPPCPQAPAISTVDHGGQPFGHGNHRKSHRDTDAATCAAPSKTDIGTAPGVEGTRPTSPVADGSQPAGDTPATGRPESTGPASGVPSTGRPGSTGPAGDQTQPASESPAADQTRPASESPASGSPASGSPAADQPQSTNESPATESPAADQPGSTGPASEVPAADQTQPASEAPAIVQIAPAKATSPTAEKPAPAPATEEPAVEKTTDGGLLGGLLGGVLDVVGGTLHTVTSTVGVVTDTLSHTVLAPLTQPPAGQPDAPVLLPLDDVLGPVFGGSSNSGGVVVTVPGLVSGTVSGVVPAGETAAAAPVETVVVTASPQATGRAAVVRPVVRHRASLPVVPDQPRDSGVHARDGGGDSTPGMPGGSTAPSAPAPTASAGHDGPGGARHPFAVHTDDVTTTQLKLMGTSRDHDVDGAGREAALPTTSPD
jgi:hypothetical protein